MNYKICIVDDNPRDAEYVSTLVRLWTENGGHTSEIIFFPSAEALLFEYDGLDPDILLLDIEMGGMNGVELAKAVRTRDIAVQLVFITGFPDFIAEGYEVSALHYLMKPVSQSKLNEVLDRAAKNIERAEKRLCVTFERETEYIPLSKIDYIEAQKQYVLIYTDGKTYRMKASLSDILAELDEYFFRCQRSFAVNLRQIVRIKPDCVVLKNGAEVPISRGTAEKIGKLIIKLF